MVGAPSGRRGHPRDRWAAYASACSIGAPQATQVADRFHLVGNIRELIERLFEQHASALDTALEPPPTAAEPRLGPAPATAVPSELIPATQPSTTTVGGTSDLSEPAKDLPPVRSHRQQRRRDRFGEVRRRRGEGQSVRRIARALRVSPKTVLRYARNTQCPDWNPGVPRATRLDRFESAVDAFIPEGG